MARRAVQLYPSVGEFLAHAESWLLRAEADNNLLLSVAHVLTTADHPFHEPLYFATVQEAGRLVGCAVCPPPDGLEVGDLPEGAAALLVDSVAKLRARLPSVSGRERAAVEFAQAWNRAYGGDWRVQYRAKLFKLDSVAAPRAVRGRLRSAVDADADLLAQWAVRYAREIDTHVDVTTYFARMLRRRTMYLWDDDGPKCAVAESGSTPNGTRIAAVYTPEEFRNRGYASNAVAAASERALARGSRFCVLFAEERPARIYARLGYRAVRDHVILELRPPSDAGAA